jgi:UDP-N-acetylmuramate--alanine ligase
VIIVDIYPARETDTLGMSPAVMAERIGERAIACPKLEDAAELLRSEVRAGDMVVIMGAGNINRMFKILEADLK